MTAARKRSRSSAKSAGSRFEREIADYLAEHVDDRIDRRPRTGSNDRGDITGLRHLGNRVVVEAKNTARAELAAWAAEAETERGNDDAVAGLVVWKRHGRADPGDQWVTCTLADLVALLTGERPDADAEAWVQDMAKLPDAEVRERLITGGWVSADPQEVPGE